MQSATATPSTLSTSCKVLPPDPDKEAQVNARNVNGASPLHIAVSIQNINLVKLLISYGADVNIKVVLAPCRNITI